MRRLSLLVLLILGSAITAAAQQLDGITRDRIRGMLNLTAEDIAKNFYDPALKGLDWKALTVEADTKIRQATTVSDAISAISTMIEKLGDSHTRFIPPSRGGRPVFGFEAKMFGNEARIYAVKPGGGAAKAGLQPGDRILQIFNYRPERKNFDDAFLYYRLIHPVSQLKVIYQRGSESPQTVTVMAKIKQEQISLRLEDVYRLLMDSDEEEKYFSGSVDGDIGYLLLPSFAGESIPTPAVRSPRAFVLDLRGNLGGRVATLGEFAGHFTGTKANLHLMIFRKKTEAVKIKPHGDRFDVPLFILVDSRSASAAEIFARYFQKTGQAKIIGDVSSGRVNTSTVFGEDVGADSVVPFAVQVAIARATFEDGEELERHPIVPDYPCLPTESDLRAHADPCLKKAFALARKAAGRTEELPDMVAAQIEKIIAERNDYEAEQLKRPD